MDSRTRSGLLAIQFEQLIEGDAARHIAIETPVATFILTRYGNVVSCACELADPSPENVEALRRRGAFQGTFMISHKLPPRDFGAWLDQVLVEDLGAEPEVTPRIGEPALAL